MTRVALGSNVQNIPIMKTPDLKFRIWRKWMKWIHWWKRWKRRRSHPPSLQIVVAIEGKGSKGSSAADLSLAMPSEFSRVFPAPIGRESALADGSADLELGQSDPTVQPHRFAFESSRPARSDRSFTVGERVLRRDKGEAWGPGYVTKVDPLRVTEDDKPKMSGTTGTQ